ncbi:MAG: tetratricopeptide repeat protein [Microcoleaceae cyanobacterium MO_207.B10]|nr:tetratricopeptide repeat protein [Microcoleaceae cyanobacterium MO_207.B10]
MQNSIAQILKIQEVAFTGSLFFLYLCTPSLAKTAEFSAPTNSLDGYIAQSQTDAKEELEIPNQFSPNPLEITEPDPLLPSPPETGVVSGEKREKLAQELDQLNVEAAALLAAGETLKAFDTWNRELRLRGYLGKADELVALERVVEIAWNNSQKLQVQWITKRLEKLEAEIEVEEPVNLQLMQALGAAFRAARARDQSIGVYQKVVAEARERQDVTTLKQGLTAIGEIYLTWLNYDNAAIAYEELLEIQQQSDVETSANQERTNNSVTATSSKVDTLRELAFIYNQAGKPLQAITAKERLVDFYQGQQNLAAIPEIKISIASDYEQLGKLNLASQYYQEAYTIAQSIQQFYSASDALENLAELYISQDKKEAAIEIYKVQLLMDQQFVNVYGMMDTYDRMGQIYSQLQAYPLAFSAFQKGLELARQLGGYREIYFLEKLNKLNRRVN